MSPTVATGLKTGACYRWTVLAIDEEGQMADATSAPVRILDTTKPTIAGRSPLPNATGVARTASITVRFSEPVKGVSATTLRLKNTRTGLWVRAKVSYSAATRSATIDPTLSMYGNERYAVYVGSGITDPSGNKLAASSWSFRTRR